MKYKTKLILVGLTGVLLSMGFLIYSLTRYSPIQSLPRPLSGEGSREETLQVSFQGEKHSLEVTLREVPYEEEQIQAMLLEAAEDLEGQFLGENEDLEHIVTDVNLPSSVSDSRIAVQWYLDSWALVRPDGTVENDSLEGEVPVQVQAVLTMEDQSLDWNREIIVRAPEDPNTEQKIRMLQAKVWNAQEDPAGQAELPDSLLGETVTWYPAADRRWLEILALTGLTLCCLIAGRRQEEEKQEKLRERSMQLAYPDIVSRLSLYMGAGVSTRKAWERIVESYEQKSISGKKMGAAYEEMRTTLYEMQSGVPETVAYERFGTRCRMPSYLKLGTLLSQNLRKGTKNLAELLAEESREAFEDRKAYARKQGEECESKLLLPMILLLLTVLIMIMYPAVVSFQM